VRRLPTNPTAVQKIVIQEKRQRLLTRLTKFHDTRDGFADELDAGGLTIPEDELAFCREEDAEAMGEEEFWMGCEVEEDDAEEEEEEEEEEEFDEEVLPELLSLCMPSSVGRPAAEELGLGKLVEEEIQL
jgi:hypothetical protein